MQDHLLSDSVRAAQNLLGYKLVYDSPQGRMSGYIVETEAYCQEDPASHSFRGKTLRTAPMFERAGTVYVYFTYGMHYCINIVTGPVDHGEAVLIRAIEPLEGIELMHANRSGAAKTQLTNGPAKLTQAMQITTALSGTNIYDGPIHLEPGLTPESVVQTTRIGITRGAQQPWRFYIQGNQYISKLASH